MPTTFTCPKCGRSGSLKKALPAGATLRCKGCQSAFSPARADDATSDHEASESQIEAFVGCPQPSPLPPYRDDEAAVMGEMMTELAQTKPKEMQSGSSDPQTMAMQSRITEAARKRTGGRIVVAVCVLVCVGFGAYLFSMRQTASKTTVKLPSLKVRSGLFDPVLRSAKAIEGMRENWAKFGEPSRLT